MGKHNSGIFVSSCNYLRIKARKSWVDGNTVPRALNFLARCRWFSNYTLQWSVIRAVFRWVNRCWWGGSRNCKNSELISKFRLFQKVNTVFSKQSISTGCKTEEQWLDSRQVQEILIFPKSSRSALQLTMGVLLRWKASYSRVKLTVHFRLLPRLSMMDSNGLFRHNRKTYTIISIQNVVYLNPYWL